MTSTDLERSIKDELKLRGLLQFVDEHQNQFLEVPEGLFAELVIRDGSRLPEVESVMREIKERLRKSGVELDEVVRPEWTVESIERQKAGPAVSVASMEQAVRYTAVLKSGSLSCEVIVDVTQGALDLLKEKLRSTGADLEAASKEFVAESLRRRLVWGGKSYWDPSAESHLELNATDFIHLRGQGPYKRLKAEIDAIFGGRTEDQILGLGSGPRTQAERRREMIALFLKALASGGVKVRDFDNALLHLPGPGGAFRPGERLATSNRELYEALFDDEKNDLKNYYMRQVDYAREDYPDLETEFSTIFR